MRIFFTGGNGKAGKHTVQYLRDQGHRVLNADVAAKWEGGNDEVQIDLTDQGQVLSAMSGLVSFDELDLEETPKFDAVVHFAAVPAITFRPEADIFRNNTLSTYNVIDTATRLGIPKIIFASSETTYGVCFAHGEVKPDYIPVDEEHPTVPHDAYAMSKVCNEVTGRSLQAKTGADIYGLRINNVIEPHEYAEMFPAFMEDPALRRRNIFAYIDVRDLAQMVECCLKTDGLGYEVFNVSNDDCSVAMPSAEIAQTFYKGIDQTREMGEFETFYANDKAKKLVGFKPQHSWRDVLTEDGKVR